MHAPWWGLAGGSAASWRRMLRLRLRSCAKKRSVRALRRALRSSAVSLPRLLRLLRRCCLFWRGVLAALPAPFAAAVLLRGDAPGVASSAAWPSASSGKPSRESTAQCPAGEALSALGV